MIGVANAPCSWGVIENVAGNTAGYRRVLDEMAETGYVGTELGDWGFMPTDPSALRDELDARGLAMVGSFATPKLQDRAHHERNADEAVQIDAAAGVGRWRGPARHPRDGPAATRCARPWPDA